MQSDLFARAALPPRAQMTAQLSTYQTPAWAADALVAQFYHDLRASDVVVEPTCGEGMFLQAIPNNVLAIGVESDPARAATAARRTGRRVIVDDVRRVVLDVVPTLVIGNPPFSAALVDALLDRAHAWLPIEGRCGLILPAFLLNQTTRVARESRRWSLSYDALPRELWPRLRVPVAFVRFEKRAARTLVGFALFTELDAMRALTPRAQHVLAHGQAPVWRSVVLDALAECGGTATLDTLYRTIEGRRPTDNRFWREKIRQTVQRYAARVAPSTYTLRECAS